MPRVAKRTDDPKAKASSTQKKLHLKLNDKPICGNKGKVRFADSMKDVTCGNCSRAIAK